MWPNSQSEPSPRDQSSQSRPDCGEKRRQRKVIGNSVNLWQARRATCRLSYFPARPVASVTGSDNWFDSNFANSGMSSPTAHVSGPPERMGSAASHYRMNGKAVLVEVKATQSG